MQGLQQQQQQLRRYAETWRAEGEDLQLPPRLSVLVTYPAAEDEEQEEQEELQPKGFNVTIGRTRASVLQLKDASVSERHAAIAWSGFTWTLRDLGSSNGTKRNGARLKPMEEAAQLGDGDVLKFGDVVCTVKFQATQAEAFTVEQLLHMQFEVMAQNLLAHQGQDVQALRQQWSTERAALVACLPPAVSAALTLDC